jgi:hypothetical protein
MKSQDDHKLLPARAIQSFWPIRSFVTLYAGVALGACGQSDAIKDGAVTVEKETAQVEMKVLPPDEEKARATASKKAPLLMDIDAYTQWFYSCHATFETEEVFHDDTIGASSMALKIKAIKFKLALPITVYLPVDAKPSLKEHEDGHVQICSIIYGRADSACVAAARQVVGKTFNGMGKDLPEARAMAMSQVQRIIAQGYQEGTAGLADQASQKYDGLCRQYADDPKMSRQSLAREACKRVLDIPVKIIK